MGRGGPPLPRPILPRERGYMERLLEYVVGDGPSNRLDAYNACCLHCVLSPVLFYAEMDVFLCGTRVGRRFRQIKNLISFVEIN